MFYNKIDRNSYFIGCAHLQHRNITRGESSWGDLNSTRDFETTEDMTRAVMDSIQSIPENSTLFILGDMLFGDKNNFQHYIDNIPTKKLVYLYGNHCKWLRNRKDLHSNFLWIGDYLEMYYHHTLICMFHYPISVWNECHHGSFLLCSHSHGSFEPSTPEHKNSGKILDCGWDVHKKPISLNEVHAIMKEKQYEQKDHHNKDTTQ